MSSTTVRQWLLAHTPLEPSLLEGAGFAALVSERVALVANGNEAAYIAALDSQPAEVERLTGDISVPETWLFRYPQSFELLADVLRRHLATGAPSLRMCSVACATGQEPYSMAITALHAGWSPDRVRIRAFDRNPETLKVAAAGKFGPTSIRGEIPSWATEFLGIDAGEIGIEDRIRSMVQFKQAEVTSSGIDGPYEVLFCRNLLIYLNAVARTKLVRSICRSLTPGGLLFVGHAEQSIRVDGMLQPIAWPHAFAMERVDAASQMREATQPSSTLKPAERLSSPISVTPPLQPLPSVAIQSSPAVPLPPSALAAHSLANARDLADAGRLQESESMVRSIMSLQSPSAPAFELLGLIRIAANDTAGAKRLFEQAVYLDPCRSTSLIQLAMMSERAGDERNASMFWARATRASAKRENE